MEKSAGFFPIAFQRISNNCFFWIFFPYEIPYHFLEFQMELQEYFHHLRGIFPLFLGKSPSLLDDFSSSNVLWEKKLLKIQLRLGQLVPLLA